MTATGSDPGDRIELSDLLVDHDLVSGARRPVALADVERRLADAEDRRAARVLARLDLPTDARGVLDPDAVDAVVLAAHVELQRLAHEFAHGLRVAEVLGAVLAACRAAGIGDLRVVDVGCGLGYVPRWLAWRGGLGDDVDLVGCDLHRRLVDEATRLAGAEGLRCRFVAGDALRLAEPTTVHVSTGFVHHLRGDSLVRFVAAQVATGAAAGIHWDLAPSALTGLGAWLFHRARMRTPLARLDGVRSAQRAHPDAALLDAVRLGAPGWTALVLDPPGSRNPLVGVIRPVLLLRPDVADASVAALARPARRVRRLDPSPTS